MICSWQIRYFCSHSGIFLFTCCLSLCPEEHALLSPKVAIKLHTCLQWRWTCYNKLCVDCYSLLQFINYNVSDVSSFSFVVQVFLRAMVLWFCLYVMPLSMLFLYLFSGQIAPDFALIEVIIRVSNQHLLFCFQFYWESSKFSV